VIFSTKAGKKYKKIRKTPINFKYFLLSIMKNHNILFIPAYRKFQITFTPDGTKSEPDPDPLQSQNSGAV
jgi:hypothetical protein